MLYPCVAVSPDYTYIHLFFVCLSVHQVRSSVVAEHLAQPIQDKSSMIELSNSFFSSELVASKLSEFEIEMERLGSRIEHLKSQNEVLSLTLQESKNNCDNLTVLIGKKKKTRITLHCIACEFSVLSCA